MPLVNRGLISLCRLQKIQQKVFHFARYAKVIGFFRRIQQVLLGLPQDRMDKPIGGDVGVFPFILIDKQDGLAGPGF